MQLKNSFSSDQLYLLVFIHNLWTSIQIKDQLFILSLVFRYHCAAGSHTYFHCVLWIYYILFVFFLLYVSFVLKNIHEAETVTHEQLVYLNVNWLRSSLSSWNHVTVLLRHFYRLKFAVWCCKYPIFLHLSSLLRSYVSSFQILPHFSSRNLMFVWIR